MTDERPLTDGDRVRLRAASSEYESDGLVPGETGVAHELHERDGVAIADVKMDRPDAKRRVSIRRADLELI